MLQPASEIATGPAGPVDGRQWVATQWLAAVALGVVGTIALLAVSIPRPAADPPAYLAGDRTGVACGALGAMQKQLRAGRYGAVLGAIEVAERAAFRSLQVSGIRFGPPERRALEIAAQPKRGPLSVVARGAISAKLERGLKLCPKGSS